MMNYIFLIGIISIFGCASAKLSGTGIVTPYGMANSINSEVDINGIK